MRLKVACVQYDPQFCQVKRNIDYVDTLLQAFEHSTAVDVLLLPEMAFTGYMFDDKNEIEAFLEDENGPTIQWAKSTAKKLGCYVQVGFPERSPASAKYYNSVAVVDHQGTLQTIYRKHFLYETDYRWASEGESFSTYKLTLPDDRGSLQVCPAICMDLNPKDFVAPFVDFEFGTFAQKAKADMVLCSMNWLASEPPEKEGPSSSTSWEEVSMVLSYWVTRCRPLLGSNAIFVGCNRVGIEKGTRFTGASCVTRLGSTPTVLDYATKEEEVVLVSEFHVGQISPSRHES